MPGSVRRHGRARTSMRLPCALVVGWLVFPAPAQASPEESLRAESLFRAGKEAYQRGEFASACPRLAESQRLEPAGGTLLALALCYESWGKNATAWALFQQAEAVARAQGRIDRVAIARQRAKALESGLSFVTVELAPDVPATVEVALDDLKVGAAALGTPTAVDAGEHRIEARHGGVTYFTKTLAVGARDSVVVAIPAPPPPTVEGKAPAAVDVPSATRAAPTVTPERAPPPPSSRVARVRSATPDHSGWENTVERVLPLGVLGVGATSLLLGGYFGVRAYQQNRAVEAGCPREPCSSSLEGIHQSAERNAARANWLVGGGAIATAASLSWLVIRGSGRGSLARALHIEASPRGAAAAVSGTF
jgi:hypothetical protein